MSSPRSLHIVLLAVLGTAASAQVFTVGAPDANTPRLPVTHVPLSDTPLTGKTRMELVRILNAEYAYTHAAFPQGRKGLVLDANGPIGPSPGTIQAMIVRNGLAAKPGDRVQITNIDVKGRDIVFELNGGPVKRDKWYQHVQVGGMGGMSPVVRQQNGDIAKGSMLTLHFDKFVPEMDAQQLKTLLSPVFDFSMKSPLQAYTDTLTPKVRQAVLDHRILVGMNREMVLYSKGRPIQKIRERDDKGRPYEEWVYGEAPADVYFVRFQGEEVTQLKIMAVGQAAVVRTEREVDTVVAKKETPEALAGEAATRPRRKPPTLRRADDPPPDGDPQRSAQPIPRPLPGTPGTDTTGTPPDPNVPSPAPGAPTPPPSN